MSRPQTVTIRRASLLQWQGGYRQGFQLKARENWLDGIFMGWTRQEAEDSARQLTADRERVGKPIVVKWDC